MSYKYETKTYSIGKVSGRKNWRLKIIEEKNSFFFFFLANQSGQVNAYIGCTAADDLKC